MVDNDTRNDATANERVGADSPKLDQDISANGVDRGGMVKLGLVTAGCAVALYAARLIPLPSRG